MTTLIKFCQLDYKIIIRHCQLKITSFLMNGQVAVVEVESELGMVAEDNTKYGEV
jgi:hypothetical protein